MIEAQFHKILPQVSSRKTGDIDIDADIQALDELISTQVNEMRY